MLRNSQNDVKVYATRCPCVGEEEVKEVICPVDDCFNKVRQYDKYCRKHSMRLARTGQFTLKTLKEKLLENIGINKDNNCWEWQKFLTEHGYGRFRINTKKVLAHRASYEIFIEKIPKGLLVCHKCDNPRCINPEHLWVGTDKDNVRDAMSKNRFWSTQRK